MSKRVAICQSNYIPWKGYFDLINSVDEFIIYDDAQFTRRDWRNRNLLKTPSGPKWLTIPVETKGRFLQNINETRVSDPLWPKRHWQTILCNYVRAPFFSYYRDEIEALYENLNEPFLSRINHRFLTAINKIIGIDTPLRTSSDFELIGNQSEKLLNICLKANASIYVSGPSASSYLDLEKFKQAGVQVEWMDYGGYLEYQQLHGAFIHGVSVLDLLFNVGADTPRFMKTFPN